jgi:hypothetical protein
MGYHTRRPPTPPHVGRSLRGRVRPVSEMRVRGFRGGEDADGDLGVEVLGYDAAREG